MGYKMREMNAAELLAADGGKVNININFDVNKAMDTVSQAMHDAFGCYKCGLHFF